MPGRPGKMHPGKRPACTVRQGTIGGGQGTRGTSTDHRLMTEDRWPITRASIIQRIRDPDDVEAWQIVVDIYTAPVFQYCIHKGLQQADALDVTQEVFTRLPRFDYQPEKGRFRAWLGTVTRNQVYKFWRKSKNRQAETELEWQPVTSAEDLDWQRISNAYILDAALKRIRDEFNETQWTAFEAVALSTMTTENQKRFVWNARGSAARVATEIGKSVEWVYRTKSEILKRLREEILFIAEELAIIE